MTLTYLEWSAAFVFLAAGLTKLGPRATIRPFLTQLGVPVTAAARLAPVVPVVELGCAVALFAGVRPFAGAAALALSGSFCGVLLYAVGTGVSGSCRCFGSLDTARVSGLTVARAAVLTALCGAVLYAQLATPRGSVSVSSAVAGALTAFVYVVGFALLDRVRDFEGRRHTLFTQQATGGERH